MRVGIAIGANGPGPTVTSVVGRIATVAVTPWTPAALGVALYAWWDADHYTLGTGSAVAQHTDRSGNGRHLLPVSTSQTLVANGVNTDKNVFRIGASNAYAKTSQSNLSTTDLTWMATAKMASGIGNTARFWDWTAYNTGAWFGVGSPDTKRGGGVRWQTGSPYGAYVTGANATWQLYGLMRDTIRSVIDVNKNGGQGVWLNGDFANIATAVNTDKTALSAGSMSVGADEGGGANIVNTDWRQVVVCNTVLSTSDRQKLEGYLAWDAGLQASLPSGHPYKDAAPTL